MIVKRVLSKTTTNSKGKSSKRRSLNSNLSSEVELPSPKKIEKQQLKKMFLSMSLYPATKVPLVAVAVVEVEAVEVAEERDTDLLHSTTSISPSLVK